MSYPPSYSPLVISIPTPSIIDLIKYSTKLKHTWITGYLDMGYSIREFLVLPFILAFDVPFHPVHDACLDCLTFLWSPAEQAEKIFFLLSREKLQLSPSQTHLSLMHSLSPRPLASPHILIINWCLMCRVLQTSENAYFHLEIQTTCTSMSDPLVTFWVV